MDVKAQTLAPDTAEVIPQQDIVYFLAGPLHDQCKALIAEGKVHPRINMQYVQTIDSVGIGLPIGLSTHCKANRGSFKITNVSPGVADILRSRKDGDFLDG